MFFHYTVIPQLIMNTSNTIIVHLNQCLSVSEVVFNQVHIITLSSEAELMHFAASQSTGNFSIKGIERKSI